ncbi:MAG TPA: hypothetical protein VGB31_07135 [Myxococcota bacterium]
MTNIEALTWLLQVDGRLYQTKTKSARPDAWVAVVPVPGVGARKGKLIVALGESAEEATTVAEGQWQTLWEDLSKLH